MPPSDRIVADIKAAIETGTLAPGQPIPSLHALVKEYGVNRKTAEKAQDKLRAAGLVEYVNGMGHYVRGNADITKTP